MKKYLVISALLSGLIANYADAAVRSSKTSMMEVKTSFSDVVKSTAPSVVNIYAAKIVTSNKRRNFNPLMDDPFFSQFLGGMISQPMRKKLERSLGSGVVVSPEGFIVTNSHVVQAGAKIKVVFNDGREFDAEFVGADESMDIAVLKIESDENMKFDHLEFGDSDSMEVGDIVLALGNPYGVGQSVSMGIVSALGRTNIGTTKYENFIQTDAAVNPGNSGGALVDSLGNLVGINTAIYTKTGGSQGISFAIPASSVKVIFDSVRKTGKVVRPWLGAGGQNLTPSLAEQLGLDRPTGVLINEIDKGSSAEKSGIKVGDIIVKFAGQEIRDTGTLSAKIAVSPIGKTVPINVWRGGEIINLSLKLEGLPERKESDRITLKGNSPLAGYTFEKLSPALNDELGLPFATEGIAAVERASGTGHFSALTLREGDIMISINNKDIKTLKDLKDATSRRPRSWKVIYKRGKNVIRAVVR